MMKTDQWIALLATQAGPAETGAARRRFALALGWGLCAAILEMAVVFGVRPDIAAAALMPMFWVKLLFPAVAAASALAAAARLGHPGMGPGRWPAVPVGVLAVLWLLAVGALMNASAGERKSLVFGTTWLTCPLSIAFLALPVLVAAFWAIKGLAPTRLALSGAAAGLLAGGAGAAVYALHCPEMAAPFLAIWYVLGIAVTTLLGALLGPRLLRW